MLFLALWTEQCTNIYAFYFIHTKINQYFKTSQKLIKNEFQITQCLLTQLVILQLSILSDLKNNNNNSNNNNNDADDDADDAADG